MLTESLESHERSLSPLLITELLLGAYMAVVGYNDIPSTLAMGRAGGTVLG
jgi:hypothetical protein